jgi:hypothetical protein
VLSFELDFDCEEFTPGTRRPLDDREISISYEESEAEMDRWLDELLATGKRCIRARDALADYG